MIMVSSAAKAGTADSALQRAWEAFYNGEYVTMNQIARAGIDTGKDQALWHEMLALSMIEDPMNALPVASKAATLAPMNGHILATEAFFMTANGKKLNRGMQIALKAEALAPNSSWVHTMAGMAMWRGGKTSSMAEFEQALNLAPNDFEANLLASKYYLQTNLDEKAARTCIERLVTNYPKSAIAYFERAEMKRKLSDPDGAVKDYSKAIELKPNYVGAYMGRARTQQFMRRFPGAIADYDVCLRATKYVGFYSLRAECYEQLRQYDKAIADFSDAIKSMNGVKEGDQVYDVTKLAQFDQYRHQWLKRIALYEKSGQYSRAVSDADKVLKAEPDCEPALNLRQNSLRKLGKYEAAISDLTQLIKIAPSAKWYRERADVYAKLNRDADSKADLDRAGRLERL